MPIGAGVLRDFGKDNSPISFSWNCLMAKRAWIKPERDDGNTLCGNYIFTQFLILLIPALFLWMTLNPSKGWNRRDEQYTTITGSKMSKNGGCGLSRHAECCFTRKKQNKDLGYKPLLPRS
jgi:hypothetical protein